MLGPCVSFKSRVCIYIILSSVYSPSNLIPIPRYPSAFVIESDFKYSDNKIHTTQDKLEYLDFKHMLQHARMTLALAYELAFAKFE